MEIISKAEDITNLPQTLPPLLRRIYANRGIKDAQSIEKKLTQLLPFHALSNINQAAELIFKHMQAQNRILIIGDFDADGATSTALAMQALQDFGAKQVDFLVPNRFEYGYGLTPEIVEEAHKSKQPHLIITVDNGIANLSGVERAKQYGIDVLITDHHLPAAELPKADVIVNPNQPGDQFNSKNLAGVGVIFYVMLAVRQHLRTLNWFEQQKLAEPNMADYLDLVALGTIADVVPLDHNNRILVHQGLGRMRHAKIRPGIRALAQVAQKRLEKLTSRDLGFALGPRLNAAGRLEDMTIGIQCLLAKDETTALQLAQKLQALNVERREIEAKMQNDVTKIMENLHLNQTHIPASLCFYEKTWHQGVIGILASRIKERYHRPVIAFAQADTDTLKGSGRSIRGLHLRDVLDLVSKQAPNLIIKFGGHAMAAGLTIRRENFQTFAKAFNQVIQQHVDKDVLQQRIFTDGELTPEEISLPLAKLIANLEPWGQGFPEPQFIGEFAIIEQRLLAGKHMRFSLKMTGANKIIPAVLFNADLN
ncbi:MAG: single-stranded-DNA-specific exonuclease RecJ, partial [Pseudomonadota bacterium]